MALGKEMQDRIYKSLDEQFGQIGFFQDQVILVDDEKKIWDTAIESLDGNLLGQIEIVNRAIDDVKDGYNDYFTIAILNGEKISLSDALSILN